MAKTKLSIDDATTLIGAGEATESGDGWEPTNDVDELEARGVFTLLLNEEYNREWDNLLAETVSRYFSTGDIPENIMLKIIATVPKEDGDYDYPETYSQLDDWNAWTEFEPLVVDIDDLDDWDTDEEEEDEDNDRPASRWDDENW